MLSTYGRSSGCCINPIEKKPLNHFLPGTPVLSFGTAGDSDPELDALSSWVVERLGPDVPLHFTAFHPDWRLLDRPPTPRETLARARRIAIANGMRYVYTGNVSDPDGQSTWCSRCGQLLIERDWYSLGAWNLDGNGRCRACGEPCAGVFEARPGSWGARRQPVRLRS